MNLLFTTYSDKINFVIIPKKTDLKRSKRRDIIKRKSVLDLSESDKIE